MSDNQLLDELVNFINTHIFEFEKLRSILKKANNIDELENYKQQILYINYISDKLNYGVHMINLIKTENAELYNNKIMQLFNSSTIQQPLEIKKIQPIVTIAQHKTQLYKEIREYGIININTIKKEFEIPNVNLYFITDSKEFGIRINNNLITGNLMNVLSKNEQYNIHKCNNENCDNKNCKYYHKYAKNKNFNDMKYYERNLLDYEYRNLLFTSKHKIKQELPKLSPEFIEYRKHKLMHELLLFQIMNTIIN